MGSYLTRQEVFEGKDDANAAAAQKSDVVLTANYASSGAITITVIGAFSAWPNYGALQNLTSSEKMVFVKTSSDVLTIASANRGADGTSAAAGAIGQSIRFIEMHVTGVMWNRLADDFENLSSVDAVTASKTLTEADCGRLQTNEGASGAASGRAFTLPSAAAGLHFAFYDQDGDGIRIVAAAGDTIRIGSLVTKVAGYVEIAQAGAMLKLRAINATEWIADETVNPWTVEDA